VTSWAVQRSRRLLAVFPAVAIMTTLLATPANASAIDITGQIQSSAGSAVPNMPLKLTVLATGGFESTTSDAQGNFLFPSVTTGAVSIELNPGADNPFPRALLGSPAPGLVPNGFTATFTLTVDSNTTNLSIQIPPTVTVGVTVHDDLGQPVPDALVAPFDLGTGLHPCPNHYVFVVGSQTTKCGEGSNWNGASYTDLNGVANLTLLALNSASTPIIAVDTQRSTLANIVSVATNSDANAEIQLPKGTTMSGRVTEADGTPITGLDVQWEPVGSPWGLVSSSATTTDGDGRYAFTGISPLLGNLYVSAPCALTSCRSNVYPDPTHVPQTFFARLQNFVPELNMDESLTLPPLAVIQAHVQDAQGNPIAGATVGIAYRVGDHSGCPTAISDATSPQWLCQEGNGFDRFVPKTDAYGDVAVSYFAIDSPETLIAYASDGSILGQADVATMTSQAVVIKPQTVSVVGRTLDSNGSPLAGVDIIWRSNFGRVQTTSDQDGNYVLSVLPASGDLYVGKVQGSAPVASLPREFGGFFWNLQLDGSQGPLTVNLPATKTFSVHIQDEDGHAVAGAAVFQTQSAPGPISVPNCAITLTTSAGILATSDGCSEPAGNLRGVSQSVVFTNANGDTNITLLAASSYPDLAVIDMDHQTRGATVTPAAGISDVLATIPNMPPTPVRLTSNVDATSVSVQWTPGATTDDPTTDYTVTVTPDASNANNAVRKAHLQNRTGPTAVSVTVGKGQKRALLTGLAPGSHYTVTVTANSPYGPSKPATIAVTTTDPRPAPVLTLTLPQKAIAVGSVLNISGSVKVGSGVLKSAPITCTVDGASVPPCAHLVTSTSGTFACSLSGLGAGLHSISISISGTAAFKPAQVTGTVTVGSIPTVTVSSSTSTAIRGSVVQLTANISGAPTPHVQWQYSRDGLSYSNVSGANSLKYGVTITAVNSGWYWRAVATNLVGSKISRAIQVKMRAK